MKNAFSVHWSVISAGVALIAAMNAPAGAQTNSGRFATADCSSKVEPLGTSYVTNNPLAVPVAGKKCHRYYAEITNNRNNKSLHYHKSQGRFDGKLVKFPFDVVARNIGIGTLKDAQTAPVPTGRSYVFAGLQVHVTDFASINSSHVVVGHRGKATFTVEGKNTVDGRSSVNDVGTNTAPAGRADLRIVGNEDRTLTVYWQPPNLKPDATPDKWQLYRGTGQLPGRNPRFGAQVYVGLITYAYGFGNLPFVGTADALDVIKQGQ